MNKDFTFAIKSIRFDENYQPSDNTRITTNFANLARGNYRRENLRNALRMIDNRFNALANWDNAQGDRYSIELEIISVDMDIQGSGEASHRLKCSKPTLLTTTLMSALKALWATTSLHTFVITTLAFCCWTTTKTSPVSASQLTSVICMANCSKLSLILSLINSISKSCL